MEIQVVLTYSIRLGYLELLSIVTAYYYDYSVFKVV
jgi:hypothetical protein